MTLGTMADIARLAGRQPNTCHRWPKKYDDFPTGFGTLGSTKVKYELNDVATWLLDRPELVTELGSLWQAAQAVLDARHGPLGSSRTAQASTRKPGTSEGPQRIPGGFRHADGRVTKTLRPRSGSRPVRAAMKAFLAAHPTCVHCGHGAADVIDHITPLSRGGVEDDPANWQSSHGVLGCPQCGRKCNSEKGNQLDSELKTIRTSVDWFAGMEGLA